MKDSDPVLIEDFLPTRAWKSRFSGVGIGNRLSTSILSAFHFKLADVYVSDIVVID
jgi:hypothetical protein